MSQIPWQLNKLLKIVLKEGGRIEKKDSVLGPIFCNMFIKSLAKKANAHDTKLGGIAKHQKDRNIQIYMIYDSLNSQNWEINWTLFT